MPKTYDEKQANECGGWPPPEEKLGQPAQQGCQRSAAAVKASVPVPQISMIAYREDPSSRDAAAGRTAAKAQEIIGLIR